MHRKALTIIATLLVLRPAGPGAVAQSAASGQLSEREAAVHVLNRLGFGPRPGDVESLLAHGIDAYIDAQLHPEAITDDPSLAERLSEFESPRMSTEELLREYPLPALLRRQMRRSGEPLDSAEIRAAARRSFQPLSELGQARLARAVYSDRQLQEVMVDFWLNHFNVFSRKGPVRLFLIEYERDVIRPNALGTFRELLGAVARSPAMLFYLDNWMSAAPEGAARAAEPDRRPRRYQGGPGRGRATGLNENYARELLELHTLGVDGGYTQNDIVEVARAFTGWTIDLRSGHFVFRPDMHDADPKNVLGHEISGGGITSDGEQVLDLLAQHPSTARFIAEQLARRFVSDNPPASLVERAAETFRATDGDLREVVRTIVASPELFSREAYRAKVKTPLEWLVSGVRGLGLEPRSLRPLLGVLQRLDQPLYGAAEPTGYSDEAEAWISSGALLGRAEFAQRLAQAGVRSRFGPAAEPGVAEVEATIESLLPAEETARLLPLIEVESAGATRRARIETALSLTLASPEFQRK